MLDMSVVVTLESTLFVQAALVFFSNVSNTVPAGISLFTLSQACCDDTKDTPTLEVTLVELIVKTAPRRAKELCSGALP